MDVYLALREKMVVVFLKTKLQETVILNSNLYKPTIEPVFVTLPVRNDDVSELLHYCGRTAGH